MDQLSQDIQQADPKEKPFTIDRWRTERNQEGDLWLKQSEGANATQLVISLKQRGVGLAESRVRNLEPQLAVQKMKVDQLAIKNK
jgi:hypothetical protein